MNLAATLLLNYLAVSNGFPKLIRPVITLTYLLSQDTQGIRRHYLDEGEIGDRVWKRL